MLYIALNYGKFVRTGHSKRHHFLRPLGCPIFSTRLRGFSACTDKNRPASARYAHALHVCFI